jgi:hypothetical protein
MAIYIRARGANVIGDCAMVRLFAISSCLHEFMPRYEPVLRTEEALFGKGFRTSKWRRTAAYNAPRHQVKD